MLVPLANTLKVAVECSLITRKLILQEDILRLRLVSIP